MQKYNLTLTQKQADLLVRALDLFSRIGIGQFEMVLETYDYQLKLTDTQRAMLREDLKIAKASVGHFMNGSHGINHPDVHDDFRAAYDLQQVIRHRLAWDRNPKGGIQVNFDQPRQVSELPLPTIAKVEE